MAQQRPVSFEHSAGGLAAFFLIVASPYWTSTRPAYYQSLELKYVEIDNCFRRIESHASRETRQTEDAISAFSAAHTLAVNDFRRRAFRIRWCSANRYHESCRGQVAANIE